MLGKPIHRECHTDIILLPKVWPKEAVPRSVSCTNDHWGTACVCILQGPIMTLILKVHMSGTVQCGGHCWIVNCKPDRFSSHTGQVTRWQTAHQFHSYKHHVHSHHHHRSHLGKLMYSDAKASSAVSACCPVRSCRPLWRRCVHSTLF